MTNVNLTFSTDWVCIVLCIVYMAIVIISIMSVDFSLLFFFSFFYFISTECYKLFKATKNEA